MVTEWLSRNISYPLWEMLSSRRYFRFKRHLEELERSQWADREELDRIKLDKLKMLVSYAYENVPYYTELFDGLKLKPQDIKELGDIDKIPVLTKEIINSNFQRLLSKKHKEGTYWIERTGGSTGNTCAFYRDHTTHEFALAVNRRFYKWAGYDTGTKFFTLRGGSYDDHAKPLRLRTRIHYHVTNHVIINTFDMSEKDMLAHSELMNRFKPTTVHGFANSVYVFAKFLKERGIDFPRPRSVITASEMLYDYQRQLIEEVFGCKVFDEYGCKEMSVIAFECESHSGLHIAEEKFILEVLQDGKTAKEGETGKIIITDLNNYAMPFLRYQNGDACAYTEEECDCKRKLRRIESLEGRLTDFLKSPEGKFVSGVAITEFLARIPGIKEFQVIQTSLERLEVRLVRGESFNNQTESQVISRLKKSISDKAQIEIRYAEKIETTASGKRKPIVMNLPVDI